jgi:hypothetical protein
VGKSAGGTGDAGSYGSSDQAAGLAAQGGGQYPGRVGESRGGAKSAGGTGDAGSYGSSDQAAGLAAQGGGQYPGRVGESRGGGNTGLGG